MQLLTALQAAQQRLDYIFMKEDFSQGKVGSMMIPEDFNFEENVSTNLLDVPKILVS